MNNEKINAEAGRRYPDYKNPSNAFNPAVPQFQREAFTAGAEWAAGEMEKFTEWTSERCWNHLYGKGWQKVMRNKTVYITTSELYQMFKQQKP